MSMRAMIVGNSPAAELKPVAKPSQTDLQPRAEPDPSTSPTGELASPGMRPAVAPRPAAQPPSAK
jgi:hypothetical protein